MANLNYYYFWSNTPPNKPKFFSFYRASRLKGWAVHTSSTVQSELLLIMEYTTYMITLVHNHHWMSLLEPWNWGFFLSPWMPKIFEEDIWFRLPNWEIVSLVPVSLDKIPEGSTSIYTLHLSGKTFQVDFFARNGLILWRDRDLSNQTTLKILTISRKNALFSTQIRLEVLICHR